MNAIAEQILAASDRLSERLAALPPVGDLVALDPTRYCRSAWSAYLHMAARPGCCLIVGMNPGPHGMAQTGVLFTDPHVCKELNIERQFPKPDDWWHPAPVGSWSFTGTDAGRRIRREESAKRLWGLLREICAPYCAGGPSADKVAEATRRVCRDVLLVNALPTCWLDPSGKNVSAEQVVKRATETERDALQDLTNEWLQAVAEATRAVAIVGVGRWASDFVYDIDVDHFDDVVGRASIKHPSPKAGSEQSWRTEAEPVLRRAIGLAVQTRAPVRETREEYLERMKDPEGCEY